MVAIQLRRARRALQARQTAGDTDPLKTIRRRLRRRHEVTDAEGHHHHHHHDKDPTPADDAANDASNQEVTQSEETANPHQHSYQHNHQHHHRHEAGTDRQTSARGRHSQHVIHTHENFQDDDDVDAHADADTDANSHQAPAAASEDAPAAESAKETDASQPHDHHGSHQPQKAEASVRQAGLAEPAAVELPPLDWPLDGINAGSKATEANPAFAGAGTGQVTGQATAAPLNAAEHHQKADPMHLGSLPGGVVTLLAILIGGGALLIVVVIVVRRRRRRAVRWSTALPKQSHIHVDPIDYASAYGAAERGEPNRFDPGAPILGGAGFVAPTEGYVHAGTAGRWERGEAAPRPETMLFDHTVPSTQRRHDGHPIMASAVAHDWMPGRGRGEGDGGDGVEGLTGESPLSQALAAHANTASNGWDPADRPASVGSLDSQGRPRVVPPKRRMRPVPAPPSDDESGSDNDNENNGNNDNNDNNDNSNGDRDDDGDDDDDDDDFVDPESDHSERAR